MQFSIFADQVLSKTQDLIKIISQLSNEEKIEAINSVKKMLHEISPFRSEPVDCVVWISSDEIKANDYNPNSVAPPEMKLLEKSISSDGYTQPIVAWPSEGKYEVVDGFHRNRVGKESQVVRQRTLGYLPCTIINKEREEKGDRIASTIRHNRARGKHAVDSMTDIVIELKRRNWSDEKIGDELGMDTDEILRLTQISGLTEMFKDQNFSLSWDVDGIDDDQISFEEPEDETNLSQVE